MCFIVCQRYLAILCSCLAVSGLAMASDTPASGASSTADSANITLQPVFAEISAPSLANNRIGTGLKREIAVVLPASYAASPNRAYPTVYVLAGHDSSLYSMLPLKPITRAVLPPDEKEVILVFLDAKNELGGAFYINSPISGNWGDFVAQDVVGYVDSQYRTLAQPASRGVVGHSMGGSGALQMVLNYPSVFSAAYAISPGVFSEKGLQDS